MPASSSSIGSSERMSPVLTALASHAESLVAEARVLVVGDAESGLSEALVAFGARSVHTYDPSSERAGRASRVAPRGVVVRALAGDIDVRDGAFDLAIVPDLGLIDEPSALARKLRRVVSAEGAVLATARARMPSGHASELFPELAPASLDYAELYDVFAMQFDVVTLSGVLPFEGVVFAELGTTEELAVSVDTRRAPERTPDVFAVLATRASTQVLDAYAIVQVASLAEGRTDGRETEHQPGPASIAPAYVAELEERIAHLLARAERAEGQLALHVADLADVVEAHGTEASSLEAQLQERAGLVAELEREIVRREQMIQELVIALDEARAATREQLLDVFEAPVATPSLTADERERLADKLDELALEVARREGELVARGWKIAELERALEAASRIAEASPRGEPEALAPRGEPDDAPTHEAETQAHQRELDRLHDELDALRQALTQEHVARISAESVIEQLGGRPNA